MAKPHKVGFVILFAVPPHSFGQLLCPSPNFIHFFLVTLHYVSFTAKLLRQQYGNPLPKARAITQGCCILLQLPLVYYTSFAALRHTFIAVGFSPSAANNCARLARHRLRYRGSLSQTLAYTTKAVCHVQPFHCVSIMCDAHFTVHPSRWHSQSIPFVPHSIAFVGSLLRLIIIP